MSRLKLDGKSLVIEDLAPILAGEETALEIDEDALEGVRAAHPASDDGPRCRCGHITAIAPSTKT